MKNTRPLFTDKATLLYKEFDHVTSNGTAIYLYIFARNYRQDDHDKTWKPYTPFDHVKMIGQQEDISIGDDIIIHYTRKSKTSWDFKLLATAPIITL